MFGLGRHGAECDEVGVVRGVQDEYSFVLSQGVFA